jgi:hypothetical protein
LDAANATVTTESRDVEIGETDCVPPEKPADIVTYGDPVRGPPACETREVTVSTDVFTVTHEWDKASWEWVASEPVKTVETTTDAATLEECPRPAKPEPIVEVSWSNEQPTCEVRTVTRTQTTTTTNYVDAEDGFNWVKGEPVSEVTDTMSVTKDASECPVVNPPKPTFHEMLQKLVKAIFKFIWSWR